MLSVEDARRIVLNHCAPLPPERMPLHAAALGRILAEIVYADLDMPPLDRSIMDGYAVRRADLPDGKAILRVVEEITAGKIPTVALAPGQASRIMTGAPIPQGADAVVAVERTRQVGSDQVEIQDNPPGAGQHILRRGQEMRKGDGLLTPGTLLRPQEIGLLATAGRTAVDQVPRPRVAVLATGDELIDAGILPGPGQIRNSNAPMLMAQVSRAGGMPSDLGIGRDSLDSLLPLIREGLRTAHVLVLSGGVSEGTRDLVPQALDEAGITGHFHKVLMKPGKPIFFGTANGAEGKRLVFGLPGNPISSFVCFEVFLRPALRRLGGHTELELPQVSATLAASSEFNNNRPTFHPAQVTATATGWSVRPMPWFGSANLRAFLQANALLRLPAGQVRYEAGHLIDVLRLDG